MSLHLRSTILTSVALVLGLSAARSASAQQPSAPDSNPALQEPGPRTPEFYEAGGGQQRTSTGQSSSNPVLTPGYFEVVCPAICYGGAFHLCGRYGFGGPGYYGPFRRYWGYGTYGPSFNIGPDNSLQYGLISGVMYEVQRSCKGRYKHGTDRWAASGAVPPVAGTGATPGGGASSQPAQGAGQQPAEKPAGYSARLRLRVPENAEVLVEGRKTASTGTIREFVSPPLEPGKNMIYSVLVRYNEGGKNMEETHTIRVHANDQLDVDCTHQPAAQARVESRPRATVPQP